MKGLLWRWIWFGARILQLTWQLRKFQLVDLGETHFPLALVLLISPAVSLIGPPQARL